MSDPRREMVAQGVIAVAVCLGGYVTFVEPARALLARERAAREELTHQVRDAEGVEGQAPLILAALERVRRDAASLTAMGEMARDERRLYAAVVAAAEASAVALDQLNPATMRASAGRAPDAAAANDSMVVYSITATGSYQGVAAFLRSLQGDLGLTVVKSVAITGIPGKDPELVRATIETEHHFFDPSGTPAGATPVRQASVGEGK